MSDLVEKWKAFCEWQRRPSRIPQMTEEHHRCCTCGQKYQGNYCPCCGQSARIGRYSFKNALLLFFDVWGMGNRGMFRTLRDLILRPGYLIRDYVSGMQMAYFPPFKLLFLLTAFSLVIQSGANLKGENYFASHYEQTVNTDNTHAELDKKKEITSREQEDRITYSHIDKIREFEKRNPAFYWLLMLFVLSLPLYLFFRKSPNIPDLRYSELLIALVYTWGMQDIYEIVLTFFGVYEGNVSDAAYLLCIIPLKQLSGFKWWRTSLYVILSSLAALAIFLAAVLAVIEIVIFLEA
jgi:hypothetical protein